MMTVRIQIIIAVAVIIFIICLATLARKKSLDLKYILAWLLVALGVLVLDLIPGFMPWLSDVLGVFSPVNMVFFVGFIYLGIVVFALSVAISRQSVRMKKMIQEIALLRRELDESKQNKTH
ncbi:MAG: DUF2304 domain-containing protein [Saccharofermentans sp.]|nr:DUF2304 domain-containing protein [Saccharofermentans sp.]